MTPEQFKVYENRLRRSADRQGYKLEKSRAAMNVRSLTSAIGLWIYWTGR